MLPRRLAFALLAAVLSLPACAGAGRFTWYSELPRSEWGSTLGEYVINVGDTIRVQVYEQEALTTTVKIRSDGRIALPFIGEVVAAGKHPSAFAQELQSRFKEFIVSPRVTVNVDQSQPLAITVLGEVKSVGPITRTPPVGLLDVLAQAGGLNEYADRSAIYILRRTPQFRRIRFTYDALIQNRGGAATFPLQSGDTIVVE